MKKFETPEIEVVTFAVEDIITVSSEEPDEMGYFGENCVS